MRFDEYECIFYVSIKNTEIEWFTVNVVDVYCEVVSFDILQYSKVLGKYMYFLLLTYLLFSVSMVVCTTLILCT